MYSHSHIYCSSACSINLGSKVILTGGYQGTRVITYYQDLSYDEKLPHLLGVRLDHGCSFFDNADGTKVNINFDESGVIL